MIQRFLHIDRWLAGAILLAAILFVSLAWQPLSRLGPGIDEVAHVGAAVHLQLHRDNFLNPEHPPLVKWLAGWSIRWLDDLHHAQEIPVGAPRNPAQWWFGRQVLTDEFGQLDRDRLLAARLPNLAIALLGLLASAGFAQQLGGRTAAIGTSFLYAASPTILAGSAMLLTDLPIAVFALCGLWCAWNSEQRGSVGLAVLAGTFCGAAVASKYSGVLAPMAVVMLLVLRAGAQKASRSQFAIRLAGFGSSLVASTLLLLYPLSLSDYIDGLSWVGANHHEGYRLYAFGNASTSGFFWYFPAALLVKATLPELIGAAALLGLPLLVGRDERSDKSLRWLWLAAFPLTYFLALVAFAPSIGHRYLTPIYPFACIGVGLLLARLKSQLVLLFVLLPLQLASALVSMPDPLSFFNGIAGCRNILALRCLDDSSLDWGQNMPLVWDAIAPELQGHEVPALDIVAGLPASAYMPRSRIVADDEWFAPKDDLYVISAHVLVRRLLETPDLEQSALFSRLDPERRIGNSYFVVDLRDPVSSQSGAVDSDGQDGLEPREP